MGYLLDPRYAGRGMEKNLREELEDFILNINKDQSEAIFCELNAFRMWAETQKEQNTFR